MQLRWKSFQIEDPTSPGRIVTVLKRSIRCDVNAKQIKQMAVKERHLQSLIDKFERSRVTFERARAVEATFETTWDAKSDVAAASTLRELQARVDEMSHRARVTNADRKGAKNAASALGGRFLRIQITGELFWEIPVMSKTKTEEIGATTEIANTEAGESNQKEKRAPANGALGLMSKWMKSWRGR
ncbi:hypothetical protein BC830DRAFT_1218171 [Chytriomyces sp. MP71]|nr:hypothetical protein BC830DRAFT_1218171 [Chytriomyces sp. MP71]